MSKICLQCQIHKPLIAFSKYKANEDGLAKVCRDCYIENANRRPYTQERKERIQKWDKDNKEKVHERNRRWVNNHRAIAQQRSQEWSKKNRHKTAEYCSRRRALKKNAPLLEKIDRISIYLRDKWICQLCLQKISPKAKGDMGPSLDHVIPLSKGGNHTAQNIVLVHKKCNSQKGNRAVPQQQRLFG